MKVYQVWYETRVGPTFSSQKKALAYLGFETEEERKGKVGAYGYPDIREIFVDNVLGISWDR